MAIPCGNLYLTICRNSMMRAAVISCCSSRRSTAWRSSSAERTSLRMLSSSNALFSSNVTRERPFENGGWFSR